MRLIVTRPEPDGSREAALLTARGHLPVLAPLLKIEFSNTPLELTGAQALIATSRNAIRALSAHPQRDEAVKLRLFAVGEATTDEARKLGFGDVVTGPGTATELGVLIARCVRPERGPLVHLAGDTLAFDLSSALKLQGFTVRKALAYRAVPVEALAGPVVEMLEAHRIDGVILMSPRTAGIFAALLAKHRLVTQAKRLICYCLSEAVAEEVAALHCAIRVAAHPREEDVLALLDSEAASS
jgi:uroporphyrinogen-III synthase